MNLAELSVENNAPGLALADANGKTRAMLSVLKDEPALVLFDANERVVWFTPR